MIEYTTQDIIEFLMNDNHISMDEAMNKLYTSKTFEKLQDVETGLYLEGSSYVYEILKKEQEKQFVFA